MFGATQELHAGQGRRTARRTCPAAQRGDDRAWWAPKARARRFLSLPLDHPFHAPARLNVSRSQLSPLHSLTTTVASPRFSSRPSFAHINTPYVLTASFTTSGITAWIDRLSEPAQAPGRRSARSRRPRPRPRRRISSTPWTQRVRGGCREARRSGKARTGSSAPAAVADAKADTAYPGGERRRPRHRDGAAGPDTRAPASSGQGGGGGASAPRFRWRTRRRRTRARRSQPGGRRPRRRRPGPRRCPSTARNGRRPGRGGRGGRRSWARASPRRPGRRRRRWRPDLRARAPRVPRRPSSAVFAALPRRPLRGPSGAGRAPQVLRALRATARR